MLNRFNITILKNIINASTNTNNYPFQLFKNKMYLKNKSVSVFHVQNWHEFSHYHLILNCVYLVTTNMNVNQQDM